MRPLMREQDSGRPNRIRRDRGAAIVLVLFVMIIFFILIGSLLQVLAMEAHAAKSSVESNAALTAAYSGVDAQILAIEDFYASGVGTGNPPDAGVHLYPNQSGGANTTEYNTGITTTYSDIAHGRKYFLITSTGSVVDSATGTQFFLSRQVTALVKEGEFGEYAQFVKRETPNVGGRAVWYTSGQQFDGLVYSGGPMHIAYTPGDPNPIFPKGFETSSDPIRWYNETTHSYTGVPTGSGYSAVFGPSATFLTGITKDLPGLSQNLIVFSEAFKGDGTQDTLSQFQNDTTGLAPGVYVDGVIPPGGSAPMTTGIFIQGDAEVTAASAGNTQTFVYTSPSGAFAKTTVAIDFTANQTTVTEGGTTTIYGNAVASGTQNPNSSANGAIFVNGSLAVDAGSTIHGQYTMALPDPPLAGQEITLKGDIQYQTEPDPAKGITSGDELALWANDIVLKDGLDGPVRIDAMLMTGFLNECNEGPKCRPDGSFFNFFCNGASCTGGMGDITLYGSLIQNIRGKLGELDSNGNLIGGFKRDAVYDGRLGANPPPFTPTTNEYDIIALSDDGSL